MRKSPQSPKPDKAPCSTAESGFRGFFDCRSADGIKCAHHLKHTSGSFCLHPDADSFKAPKKKTRAAKHLIPSDPQLSFRRATTADCAILGDLNFQLIHDLHLPHLLSREQMVRRMRRFLKSGHRAILFEQDDQVLAYALYRESKQEIYLRQFLVVRKARRKGVARRALAMLRSQIWSKRKRLTLEVLVTNRRALEFWRKVGYVDHALKLEIPPTR